MVGHLLMKGYSMIVEINAGELRKQIGHYLNEVKYKHNSLVIKRGNEKVCAVIDIELFEKFKQMQADYELVKSQMAGFTSTIKDDEEEKLITSAIKYAKGI